MFSATLNLPTISQEIALNTNRLFRGLSDTETRIQAFSRRMANIGAGLTLAVSIPVQLVSTLMVNNFAKLEDSAIRTAARTGQATKQMVKDIMDASMTLSKQIPIDPLKLSQSFGVQRKAGITADLANELNPRFAKFAVVNDVDVVESTKHLIDLYQGLGLATGDATKDFAGLNEMMDVTTVVQSKTTANVEDFMEGMQKGRAVANLYGISFKDLAASIATFETTGVHGVQAGQRFEIGLLALTNASTKYAKQWEHDLGPNSVFNAEGGLREMPAIIDSLQKKLGTLSDKGKIQLLEDLHIPRRAISAVSGLLGMTEQTRKLQELIKNAGGIVDQQFGTRITSLSEQLQLAWNHAHALSVEMGEHLKPIAVGFTYVIDGLTAAYEAMPYPLQTVITGMTLFLAVIGPGLLIVSGMTRVLGAMGTAMYTMSEAAMGMEALSGFTFFRNLNTQLWLLGSKTTVLLALRTAAAWLFTPISLSGLLFELGGIVTVLGYMKTALMGLSLETIIFELGGIVTVLGYLQTALVTTFSAALLTPLGLFIAGIAALYIGYKSLQGLIGSGSKNTSTKLSLLGPQFKDGYSSYGFDTPMIEAGHRPSGLTPSGKNADGTDSFSPLQAQTTSSQRFYSASELGTKEEYTARVRGQSALTGAADIAHKTLSAAESTSKNTADTVKEVKALREGSKDGLKQHKAAQLR